MVELLLIQRLYAECDAESNRIMGFVQHTGADPFFVIMYSEKQLRLLRSEPCIMHFDATGSIFRTIQGVRTRMLLYSLIIANPIQGEPPVAIAEMVASRHTTDMVSHMLLCVRLDVNRLCGRQLTTGFSNCLVVTDFSWALIHAVLHEFNDALDINSYLLRTYNTLARCKTWQPCAGVFLCVNHMIHIVSRKIGKLASGNNKLRAAFMHCFVLLQYSCDCKEALSRINDVLTLFGMQKKTHAVRTTRTRLARDLRKVSECLLYGASTAKGH